MPSRARVGLDGDDRSQYHRPMSAGGPFCSSGPDRRPTALVSSGAVRRGDPLTDDEITELLFVREEPVGADLAMVFGAANEEDLARRTHQGVRLYREGYVPR